MYSVFCDILRQALLILAVSSLVSADCVLVNAVPGDAQNATGRTGTQSPFRQPTDTKKARSRKAGKPKKTVVLKKYPRYVNRRDLYGSSGQGYVTTQPATRGTRGF